MSKSLKCADAVALMTSMLSTWDAPVCASGMAKVYPQFSKYIYAHALKQMVTSGLLYAMIDTYDRVYYSPTANHPVSLIQELICKGKLT